MGRIATRGSWSALGLALLLVGMPLLVLVTEGISGPSELEEGAQRREVITWNEVWNLSDSPVTVEEGINVDAGGSLTIESGVVVNIIGTTNGISVWGGSSLNILGTSDQPVVMNVDMEVRGVFVGGGILNATNVIFNGRYPGTGAVMVNAGDAVIEDSVFTNHSSAIDTSQGTVTVQNSLFQDNTRAIFSSASNGCPQCAVTIGNSTFVNNTQTTDGPEGLIAEISDSLFEESNRIHPFGGSYHNNCFGGPFTIHQFQGHHSDNRVDLVGNTFIDPNFQNSLHEDYAGNISGNNFLQMGSQSFAISGLPSTVVDLEGNWWGTTETNLIEEILFDRGDTSPADRPEADYEPFLTSQENFPCQTAGASDSISIPNTTPYGETLSAGNTHTCGIMDNGVVHCWGSGVAANPSPAPTNATSISSGAEHTCAILENGTVVCWGQGGSRLGRQGIAGPSSSPWPAMDLSHIPGLLPGTLPVTQISAGGAHTCVIISDGSVYCTGKNDLGQLGLGNVTTQDIYRLTRTSLPNGSHAISISAGAEHTCAVLQNGSVYCWGNQPFSLPNSESGIPEPVEFPDGYSQSAISVSAGTSHTCVVLENGSSMCWGSDNTNQLGNSSGGPSSTPIPVDELKLEETVSNGVGNQTVSSIMAGDEFTCATLSNQTLFCWGDNTYGQIGIPDGRDGNWGPHLPQQPLTPVTGPNEERESIVTASIGGGNGAGDGHVCALLVNGSAMCWGDGRDGQLGHNFSHDGIDHWTDTPGFVDLPQGRSFALPGPGSRTELLDSDDGTDDATEDSDGDSVNDDQDDFPFDANESTDTDGDGVGDNADAFPMDSTEWTDSDSDGVGDNADAFPMDPTEQADTDGDGVGDNADQPLSSDAVQITEFEWDVIGASENSEVISIDRGFDNNEMTAGYIVASRCNQDGGNCTDGASYINLQLVLQVREDTNKLQVNMAPWAEEHPQYWTIPSDASASLARWADCDPWVQTVFSTEEPSDWYSDIPETETTAMWTEIIVPISPCQKDEQNRVTIVLTTLHTGTEDESDLTAIFLFSIFDIVENFDSDNDSIIDSVDIDDDNDGWSDEEEASCGTDPLDPNSTPADDNSNGFCDSIEGIDSDGDGWVDVYDSHPDDPDEWNDSDDDGVGDNSDAFPMDPAEQTDSDQDGFGDNIDDFPLDNSEWKDTDADGVGDNEDAFPEDPSEAMDSDGDRIGDNSDAFPDDSKEWADSDDDGCGDNSDLDPNDSNVTTCGAVTIVDGGTKTVEIYGFEFDWRTMAVAALSFVIIVLGWLYYKSKAMAPEAINLEQLAIELTALQIEEDDPYGDSSHQSQAKLFLQGDSEWAVLQYGIGSGSWKTFADSEHFSNFNSSISKISTSSTANDCAIEVRNSLDFFMRHVVKAKLGEFAAGEKRISGYEKKDGSWISRQISKDQGRKQKSLRNEWNFGRADLDSYNSAYKRCGQSLRPQYDSYRPEDADFAANAIRALKEDLDL